VSRPSLAISIPAGLRLIPAAHPGLLIAPNAVSPVLGTASPFQYAGGKKTQARTPLADITHLHSANPARLLTVSGLALGEKQFKPRSSGGAKGWYASRQRGAAPSAPAVCRVR